MSGHRRSSLGRAVSFGAVVVLLFCGVQIAKSMPRPQDSGSAPKVTTKELPVGTVGKPYLKVIEAEGGKIPWEFRATGLPKGVSFDTTRGPNTTDTLHGTPTEAGDYEVEITVND